MDTHRSIASWCMFLSDALISQKSKKQAFVSKSSTESKYRAMSCACSKIVCFHWLLGDLNVLQLTHIHIHTDNISAIQIDVNFVFHKGTKHIKVDCHSICEALAHQEIIVPYIYIKHQIVVVFTEALFGPSYQFLIDKFILLDH